MNPRNNWQTEVEKLGFAFRITNALYWDEIAYYEFSMDEVLKIEKVPSDLWHFCLAAVQHVMENGL
ncbi:MAG: glutathionylspermidine synthase family protein [Segetibacter sp.]